MKENSTAKPASNKYPIIELIKNRWSPRVFSDKEISEETLHSLLEAGRWAPSSNNLQPWKIIYGFKDSDTYDRIYNCLADFNKLWANNSQVLIAGIFKKTMEDDEKENFHALHDLGSFMTNLSLQAQSMDIAVHQMAGIDFKKAAKEFNVPDNHHVATAVAVGYYGGEVSDLPEDLQKPENDINRKRKEISEFTFNGNLK